VIVAVSVGVYKDENKMMKYVREKDYQTKEEK
jgi:hypothetical protein